MLNYQRVNFNVILYQVLFVSNGLNSVGRLALWLTVNGAETWLDCRWCLPWEIWLDISVTFHSWLLLQNYIKLWFLISSPGLRPCWLSATSRGIWHSGRPSRCRGGCFSNGTSIDKRMIWGVPLLQETMGDISIYIYIIIYIYYTYT